MRIRTSATALTVAVAGAGLWLTSTTGVVASEAPPTEDPCLSGTVEAAEAESVVDNELDCAIESLEVDFGDGVTLPVQPETGGVTFSLAGSQDREVTEYQLYTSADGELVAAAGEEVFGSDEATEEFEEEVGLHTHDEASEKRGRHGRSKHAPADEAQAHGHGDSDAIVPALFRVGDDDGSVLPTVAISTMCASTDQNRTGTTWTAPLQWRYNSSGQPSTTSLTRINNAAGRVPAGTNHCGWTRSFKLSETYLGTTSTHSGVLTSTCAGSNGQNIVGWGGFSDTGTLGATCRYTIGSRIVEADIKFNETKSWYTASSTTDCSGSRYDLQGVALHEWGHAVGLLHVPQASGLVMRPRMSTCVTNDRALGRGDYQGLRDAYGYAS